MDKEVIKENKEENSEAVENENIEQNKNKKNDKKEKSSASKADKFKKELDELNDKFLRLAAEYDNFRKRSVKEKSDIYSSAKSDVINDILPVIDNFERAADNSEADFDAYKKGIELIFNQFLGILKKYGVECFGEVGDKFDPSMHSAVMVVQDDSLGENEIAQVFTKGYRMGDKIIREAVVKVANS